MIDNTMRELGYGSDSLFRFVKQESDGCSYCKTVWEDNSCLAIGPSAYSYVNGLGFQNIRSVKRFQDLLDKGVLPVLRMKELTNQEMAARALILGLKTAGTSECGVDIPMIENKYNTKINQETADMLNKFIEIGAMEKQGNRLFFTKKGACFAENILVKLMGGE